MSQYTKALFTNTNIQTTNPDRINEMKLIQKEGLELFIKKNKDYGDAFANYGPVGVLVRIGDKISRLNNITKLKYL